MRARVVPIVVFSATLLVAAVAASAPTTDSTGRQARVNADRRSFGVADGFVPAVAVQQSAVDRYFVTMHAPSVAQRSSGARSISALGQRLASREALASQTAAIRDVRARGGHTRFRYSVLVNGFSADLSNEDATAIARRSDVASVEPVSIVQMRNESSVPFIGATKVWQRLDVRGQGMTVAVVDTGIDYTHADFGGPGTERAYNRNDPNIVEPGSFPTSKVIGGFDFVGSNYDPSDNNPSNDVPRPDFDPLDRDGHGSHTGGTCCGIGVPGTIGPGVAPKAKILAYKVWDVGASTDDVLVAAYERAVDPDQDGDTSDQADVLSFSGGVDYGTLNSVEAVAAQHVVDLGTVFVAAAGNAGNEAAGASAYIVGTPATARGVISVAASIDELLANTLTVDDPAGLTLPDNGVIAVQDWGAPIPAGGLTTDLFDAREVDPPADPGGGVTPGDRQFCSALPANSLDGLVPIVFKGSTTDGDCTGSAKVFNAQEAGADAVILHSGFEGAPFILATDGEPVTITAVMVSGPDGDALLDALSPSPPAWNAQTVTVTLGDEPQPVPGFEDSMTDFTSEGPARVTNDLKPDISAPGFQITSAGVGTGTGASLLNGTSMAAPLVSGVATLMRQIHPTWSPERIKALMMNHATPKMKNTDLSTPVSATAMGAGRVRALRSATADSVAVPGSLSFGLLHAARTTSMTRSFMVENLGSQQRDYTVDSDGRYSDFDPDIASTSVSLDGAIYSDSVSFSLAPGASKRVRLRLTVDPSVVSPPEQEYGLYYFHPNVDGAVMVHETGGKNDLLRVPWHIAPLAASDDRLSKSSLDLTGGDDTMRLNAGTGAAGVSWADLYLLGAADDQGSLGEEDVVAIGARSFTGPTIDGVGEGLPTGLDPFAGISWTDFLWQRSKPREPVEIVVQTSGIHNTTETLEVDVKIDAGADGVFADPALEADYLVTKTPDPGGNVCVNDLSLADPFKRCAKLYFADYTNYNGNLVGLVVDASAIGLGGGVEEFSYGVTACTGRFSGDVPGQFCDTAGRLAPSTGTYPSHLNVTDPALQIDPLVCGGFWGTDACDGADPVHVSVGSAAAGDDPSLLAVFPNNAPARAPTIIDTAT